MTLDYSKFIKEILLPANFSPEEIDFLHYLKSDGGVYSGLAALVEKNPTFCARLLESVNTTLKDRMREPITQISSALSTMGFIPARNFLATSIVLGYPSAQLSDSKLIAEALTYALRGESEAGADATRAGDQFQAGLAFDFLAYLAPDALHLDSIISETWAHGLEISKKSSSMATAFVPELRLERQLCQDGLLHDIGKIILAFLSDGASIQWSKQSPSRTLDQNWREEIKEYGWSHELLGSIFLTQTRFLQDQSPIALYHHRPYVAYRMSPNVATRMTLIWLANQLSRYKEHRRGAPLEPRLSDNWYAVTKKVIPKLTQETFATAIK